MTEDVGRWKLASQYIRREIKEADEVNLLDEEGKLSIGSWRLGTLIYSLEYYVKL